MSGWTSRVRQYDNIRNEDTSKRSEVASIVEKFLRFGDMYVCMYVMIWTKVDDLNVHVS